MQFRTDHAATLKGREAIDLGAIEFTADDARKLACDVKQELWRNRRQLDGEEKEALTRVVGEVTDPLPKNFAEFAKRTDRMTLAANLKNKLYDKGHIAPLDTFSDALRTFYTERGLPNVTTGLGHG